MRCTRFDIINAPGRALGGIRCTTSDPIHKNPPIHSSIRGDMHTPTRSTRQVANASEATSSEKLLAIYELALLLTTGACVVVCASLRGRRQGTQAGDDDCPDFPVPSLPTENRLFSPLGWASGGTNVPQDLAMAVTTLSGAVEFAEAKHILGQSVSLLCSSPRRSVSVALHAVAYALHILTQMPPFPPIQSILL